MSNKIIILSLETTIRGGSISVLVGKKELGCWVGSGELSKAAEILPEIEKLLESMNIQKESLNLITVSNGFGSFTGARVGWALARGLGKSLDCKISGVSLLGAMCLCGQNTGDFIVCVPNGNREVSFQVFRKTLDGKLLEISQPKILKIEDFIEFANFNSDVSLISESYLYEKITGLLKKRTGKAATIIKADINLAKYVGLKGQSIIASDNVKINYMRNALNK